MSNLLTHTLKQSNIYLLSEEVIVKLTCLLVHGVYPGPVCTNHSRVHLVHQSPVPIGINKTCLTTKFLTKQSMQQREQQLAQLDFKDSLTDNVSQVNFPNIWCNVQFVSLHKKLMPTVLHEKSLMVSIIVDMFSSIWLY